jgi:hypothetical protein
VNEWVQVKLFRKTIYSYGSLEAREIPRHVEDTDRQKDSALYDKQVVVNIEWIWLQPH